MLFSHLMMSRMLLSSSCVLVLLLCLPHECHGRHLSSSDNDHAMDDHAKPLSRSKIMKGFEKEPSTVHGDHQNLKMTKKGTNQTTAVHDGQQEQAGSESKNKKGMIEGQKVKKVKEAYVHHHHQQQHNPKSLATVTFRVPPRNKRVHQQPGFNLDYSPPKTHPPSHN